VEYEQSTQLCVCVCMCVELDMNANCVVDMYDNQTILNTPG